MAKSPRSDPQRERAYAWEGAFTDWAGAHATKAAMLRAMRKCCRLYRVPMPAVFFLSKNRRGGKKLPSYYDPDRHAIYIRPRHRELNTAVHEAAHAIVDWILGPWGTQPHGREWVGVFMVLLDHMKIVPRLALAAHAKSVRLKFCAPGIIGPRQIRRRFRAKVRDARRFRRMSNLWQRG